MKKIGWDEILEFYNRIHNLHFKTPQAMLRNGLKRYGTYEELASKLGISYRVLKKKGGELKCL